MKRVSFLMVVGMFATATMFAQTATQRPGTTPDASDPTGVYGGSQTGSPGDTGQLPETQSGSEAQSNSGQTTHDSDADQNAPSSSSSSQSSVSNSESGSSTQSSASSSSPNGGQTAIHGTIDTVDSIGNNVTVHTDNNAQETLSMDGNTNIKVNGQAATVSDLKPGQRVNVTMDGQKAASVEVTESSSRVK
jgi:hypothetical protein